MVLLLILLLGCRDAQQTDAALPNQNPLAEINTLLSNSPNDPTLRYTRGQWYYEQEQYALAAQDLSIAAKSQGSPLEAHHLLADAYLDNNQSLLALETLKNATQLFSQSIPTMLKLTEFELITKQHNNALATLQRIFELDRHHAEGFFMKGLVLNDMGDTTAAKAAFHDATAEDATLIDGWIELGKIYGQQDPVEAIRYYDAALEINPNHLETLHAKAIALADLDKIQEALGIYHAAVTIDPYYSAAYFNMGLIYLDIDSLDQALDHFDLAADTDPQYTNAYFYRGVVNELLGNPQSARLDYEVVIKLDPNHQRAQEGLKRVRPAQ